MHVTAAVLVTGRYWGRTLSFLNMYGDAKELVSAADTEAQPDTSWVSEATFTGSAHGTAARIGDGLGQAA
jgi:hypothetical protein